MIFARCCTPFVALQDQARIAGKALWKARFNDWIPVKQGKKRSTGALFREFYCCRKNVPKEMFVAAIFE